MMINFNTFMLCILLSTKYRNFRLGIFCTLLGIGSNSQEINNTHQNIWCKLRGQCMLSIRLSMCHTEKCYLKSSLEDSRCKQGCMSYHQKCSQCSVVYSHQHKKGIHFESMSCRGNYNFDDRYCI